MNIIIGLTDSKKLVQNIEKYIDISNEISRSKTNNIDTLLEQLNSLEQDIMELLSQKLKKPFKVDNETYEVLDKNTDNSELRGEIFCSVNHKKGTKKIYNEISKILSPDNTVSKKLKYLLKEMQNHQFCVFWNVNEDVANELL